MAQKKWYDAQGVRFSNGMTRWNADRLDEYDRLKSGVAADD